MQGMVELIGNKTLMTNGALPLLVALTPPELNIEYILGDENTSNIDFNIKCDLVALTGYTLHAKRIKEICREFRKRNIPVALGGPHATLSAHECKGLADHLFIGEAEYTWPRFLHDWFNSNAKPVYKQETPVDLQDSPAPDWTLFKLRDYTCFTIQTRRGCPHNCGYCDVVRLHGRKVRYKTIAQAMAEVKAAHAKGAEIVFFTDDNFVSRRSYTKELLEAIIEWNSTLIHPLVFLTQVTVDIANDEEILKLLADAKFYQLFVGVESPRKESLQEMNKGHNINIDLVESIRRISGYGLIPIVGLMVGFDHDDITIFDELEEFIIAAGSPIAAISILNAPRDTPLYNRLKAEGRIIGEDYEGEWQLETNIIPKQMTSEGLISGYHQLFQRVYEIDAFEDRFRKWVSEKKYVTGLYTKKKKRINDNRPRFLHLIYHLLFKFDPEIRALVIRSFRFAYKTNPRIIRQAVNMLIQFIHFSSFVRREEWIED